MGSEEKKEKESSLSLNSSTTATTTTCTFIENSATFPPSSSSSFSGQYIPYEFRNDNKIIVDNDNDNNNAEIMDSTNYQHHHHQQQQPPQPPNQTNKQKPKKQLTFRKLNQNDRIIIQQLHEEWFPVKYEDKFYDSLVENKMMGSDDPLYSCVATVSNFYGSDGEEDEEMGGMNGESNGDFCVNEKNGCDGIREGNGTTNTTTTSSFSSVTIELLSDSDDDNNYNDNKNNTHDYYSPQNKNEIAGCIVGSFLPARPKKSTNTNTKKPSSNTMEETSSLLLSNTKRYNKMFYIMTLGTVSKYRNCGIGSTLVEKCIREVVEKDESCGVVYLHVITWNRKAIDLYERLGFIRVKEIEGEWD